MIQLTIERALELVDAGLKKKGVRTISASTTSEFFDAVGKVVQYLKDIEEACSFLRSLEHQATSPNP